MAEEAKSDISSELERMRDLHASGAITDAEYEAAKSKILSSGKGAAEGESHSVGGALLGLIGLVGLYFYYTGLGGAPQAAMAQAEKERVPYELGVSMIEETRSGCRVSFRFKNIGSELISYASADLEARDASGAAVATSITASSNIRAGGLGTDSIIFSNVTCFDIYSLHAAPNGYETTGYPSDDTIFPLEM